MASMFVRHKVADYAKWKSAYDAFDKKSRGVKAASVYRDADDANTIIVTHKFKDINAAKAFASSEDLRSAMAQAGVNGQPEIWFGEDVEHS
jgi:quinol monooxygenase YgiN